MSPARAAPALAALARCWHVTPQPLCFAGVSLPVAGVSPWDGVHRGPGARGGSRLQSPLPPVPASLLGRGPQVLAPLTGASVLAHQCPQTGERPPMSWLAGEVTPSPRPRDEPGDAVSPLSPHLGQCLHGSPAPTKPHGRLPLGAGGRVGDPWVQPPPSRSSGAGSLRHQRWPPAHGCQRCPAAPAPACPCSRPRRAAPSSPASSGFPERLPPTPTPGRRPAQPAPQIAIPAADVGAGGGGGRASAAGNET